MVATADNAASSLRSGRLFPAVPHFKRSVFEMKAFLALTAVTMLAAMLEVVGSPVISRVNTKRELAKNGIEITVERFPHQDKRILNVMVKWTPEPSLIESGFELTELEVQVDLVALSEDGKDYKLVLRSRYPVEEGGHAVTSFEFIDSPGYDVHLTVGDPLNFGERVSLRAFLAGFPNDSKNPHPKDPFANPDDHPSKRRTEQGAAPNP